MLIAAITRVWTISAGETRIMSYLSDEYKTLQDKIDKIGAFRFTIKGWSVTVVVAGLIAGATSKDSSPFLIGIVLDACLLWFYWFERQQVRLSWKFSERAWEIEREIDQMRRTGRWRSQFSAPRIARLFYVRKARVISTYALKKLHLAAVWDIYVERKWARLNRRLHDSGLETLNFHIKLLAKSDGLFYVFLLCLAWGPVLIKVGQSSVKPQPPAAVMVRSQHYVAGAVTPSSQRTEKSALPVAQDTSRQSASSKERAANGN
jgi:hypothetical protein